MTEPQILHGTVVVTRTYDADVTRVFQACADPKLRVQWDLPGEGWVLSRHEQDFRPGGREASAFGPKGGPVYQSEGTYLRIVPNACIVSAGTMRGDAGISAATLCTYAFEALGDKTRLTVTGQSAFFDGLETETYRRMGWTCILAHLGDYLEKATAPA